MRRIEGGNFTGMEMTSKATDEGGNLALRDLYSDLESEFRPPILSNAVFQIENGIRSFVAKIKGR